MQSIQANGKAYCLKCVGKQVGERNSLARAGSKCRFGSQNSYFSTNVDGRVEQMCTGRILFCVLVCGNCAYNDQLGTYRPKSNLHYTIPIKVTRIPKVSDEDQKVNFYIQELKELSKRLEKSLEINKKLSEVISEHNRVVSEHNRVNHDFILEQKKLSAANLNLHVKIDRITISLTTHSIFQVISENENLKIEIEELRNKLSFLSSI